MARRPVPAALLLSLVLLPCAATAQEERDPDQPPPPTYPGAASLEGQELSVSVAFTLRGPLVSLLPVVERLGGELRADPSGEGYFLELEGTEIVFGPGSAALTRGSEILPLSQAPVESTSAGVLAPLDFFDHTYGDLLGYRFSWDAETERLVIRRAEGRELPVELDVVHLQGVTTVVFRFPENPRYRLVETPDGVEVELLGDSLARSVWRSEPVEDPLVRGIELGAAGIRLSLAPGATAASYTLEDPFRLVFDVHRTAAGREGPAARLEPPTPREGLHTIVIDPGHGGEETGAVGPSGAMEKDLVLLLARALKSRLQSRMPVRVVLTRSGDLELPLDTRTAIANQNKADLFLSLHLNSAAVGAGARGAETFFLSLQASDERAAQAAELENQAAARAGSQEPPGNPGTDGDERDPLYDLQLILWDLAQSHHLAESQRVARLIQEELNGTLDLRDRGVKQAPFRVLMGAAMPAVLVELGFLSNPEEEARLQDPAYRVQLVEALARAIFRYRTLSSSRDQPVLPGEAEPAAGGGLSEGPR